MPAPGLPSLPNLANLASLTRHLEFRAVSRWVGFALIVGLLSGPEDTLAVALSRFAESHYQQLPVVDPANESALMGLLSYEQVLEAYSRELVRRRASESQFPNSSPPSAP